VRKAVSRAALEKQLLAIPFVIRNLKFEVPPNYTRHLLGAKRVKFLVFSPRIGGSQIAAAITP
jgi:hypothetical protein